MQNDLAAGNRLEAPWLAGGVARMARDGGRARAGQRDDLRGAQAVRRRRAERAERRDDPPAAHLDHQRGRADRAALRLRRHPRRELQHRDGRGAGARPHQHADPADPDPADAARDDPHARPLHLRHQRAPVLVRRLARPRLHRRRLLDRRARRDRVQHHLVGAVGARCPGAR